MLKTIILVCSLASGYRECDLHHSINRFVGEDVNTPTACLINAQATAAKAANWAVDNREFIKIVCMPEAAYRQAMNR